MSYYHSCIPGISASRPMIQRELTTCYLIAPQSCKVAGISLSSQTKEAQEGSNSIREQGQPKPSIRELWDPNPAQLTLKPLCPQTKFYVFLRASPFQVFWLFCTCCSLHYSVWVPGAQPQKAGTIILLTQEEKRGNG